MDPISDRTPFLIRPTWSDESAMVASGLPEWATEIPPSIWENATATIIVVLKLPLHRFPTAESHLYGYPF